MKLHSEPRRHQTAPGGLFSSSQTSRWKFISLSTCDSAAASEPQADECIVFVFLHSVCSPLFAPGVAIEVELIIELFSTKVCRSTGRRKNSFLLTYGERSPAVAVHTVRPWSRHYFLVFLVFFNLLKGPEWRRCQSDRKEAPVRFEHLLRPKLLQEIKFSQISIIVIIITRSLSVNNRESFFFEAQRVSVLLLGKFQTEQSQKKTRHHLR